MFTREEILEEVKKIQYLYRLKDEVRFGLSRTEEFATESVAEHVYGMSVLARYFLPLEDPEGKWNREKIYDMILWHDIEEIETGDIIGYRKTAADKENEKKAMQKVLANLPEIIRETVKTSTDEYEAKESIEAKFVKAIDKTDSQFQLFNEDGKRICLRAGTTLEEHNRIKNPYVAPFPYLKEFNRVTTEEMIQRGFFTEPQ